MIECAQQYHSTSGPQSSNLVTSSLGCSQHQLDEWLASAIVAPHLRPWYNLCLRSPKRFHESIGWTKKYSDGQEFRASQAKLEILRLCLTAHACDDHRYFKFVGAADDLAFNTETWSTYDIWARTAWRIVQDDIMHESDAITLKAMDPAKPYTFVIETLWTIFSSIATRSDNSRWLSFIDGTPEWLNNLVESQRTKKEDALSKMKSRQVRKKRRREDHFAARKTRKSRRCVVLPMPAEGI